VYLVVMSIPTLAELVLAWHSHAEYGSKGLSPDMMADTIPEHGDEQVREGVQEVRLLYATMVACQHQEEGAHWYHSCLHASMDPNCRFEDIDNHLCLYMSLFHSQLTTNGQGLSSNSGEDGSSALSKPSPVLPAGQQGGTENKGKVSDATVDVAPRAGAPPAQGPPRLQRMPTFRRMVGHGSLCAPLLCLVTGVQHNSLLSLLSPCHCCLRKCQQAQVLPAYLGLRTVILDHTPGLLYLQASTRFVGGILVATLEAPGDEDPPPLAARPSADAGRTLASSTGPTLATANPLFAVDESKVTLSPEAAPQPGMGGRDSSDTAAAEATAASLAMGSQEGRPSQEAASAAAASAAAAVGTLDTALTAPAHLHQQDTQQQVTFLPGQQQQISSQAEMQASSGADGTSVTSAGDALTSLQPSSSAQAATLLPLPSLPPDAASPEGLEAGIDAAAAAEVRGDLASGSAARPEGPPSSNTPASGAGVRPSEGGAQRGVTQGQRVSLHTRKRSDPPTSSSRLAHVTSASDLASLGSGAASNGALGSGNWSGALPAGSSTGLGQAGSSGPASAQGGNPKQLYLPSQSKGHGAQPQARQQVPPTSQLWDASLAGQQQPGSPRLPHSFSHSSLISPRAVGLAPPALGHSASNPSLVSPSSDAAPGVRRSGVGSGPRARRVSRYEVQVSD
jgi:hypothetical protein